MILQVALTVRCVSGLAKNLPQDGHGFLLEVFIFFLRVLVEIRLKISLYLLYKILDSVVGVSQTF